MSGHDGRTFPSISSAVAGFRAAGLEPKTRRVCWVTDEMSELFKNGGAGTVVSGFCDALLKAGHATSVLYTSNIDVAVPANAEALAALRARGLDITLLQNVSPPAHTNTMRSHLIHEWLKDRAFDIVHFHDFNGSGFAATAAKSMGLAYSQTLLCITNFGSSRWAWECMEFFVQNPLDLAQDWLERKSIENADAVLCHSRHMAAWLATHRYELPVATYVQPSIVPFAASHDGPCGRTQTAIREIVFFGRQEVRKGMRIWVDAVRILAAAHPELRFTILGKFSEVEFEHSGGYVLSRLHDIPNDLTFLADMTRDQALRYLKRPEVLAVMPSVDDNFPGTVIEAVREGIEFVASDRGGIPEIVHPDDQPARLFPLTPRALATAVQRVIAKRPPRPRLAFEPEANIADWMDWHALVPIAPPQDVPSQNPLVSACVVHYDRPALLAMVVDGLTRQTYTNFEVVIVDDGSQTAEALAYLEHLQAESHPFRLTVIHTLDVRLGAARNAAANAATGEYVVFIDDDNIPLPQMIETLVRAAQHAKLDVATCLAYILSGNQAPTADTPRNVGYYPAGGPISQGLIDNVFGDANALVRREAFEALGGFDPTPGVGAEDWDFFARAILEGYRLAAVPAVLYWYRQHGAQLTMRSHSTHLYHERLLQSYLKASQKAFNPEFEDLFRVYMGRHTREKLSFHMWNNLGGRRHGVLERQLLPHIGNAGESYRIMARCCLDMGRLRDSMRLMAQSNALHEHLLDFDQEVENQRGALQPPPQGYYPTHGSHQQVRVPPSAMSKIRLVAPTKKPEYQDLVSYGPEIGRVRVHPRLGGPTIAAVDTCFAPGMMHLSAEALVDHKDGPAVLFTLMLVDEGGVREAERSRIPKKVIARAETWISPSDGAVTLELDLEAAQTQWLTLLIATQVPTTAAYAWADVRGLTVRR